jgi:adenylate cyclase
VNLASRPGRLTREYGADIIAGEATRNAVPERVIREFDLVVVKGKDTAVAIFEPLDSKGGKERAKLDKADLFHEALQPYRKQEWQMADQRLLEQQRLRPAGPLHETFIERIAALRANPPGPDRDGAFTLQTK